MHVQDAKPPRAPFLEWLMSPFSSLAVVLAVLGADPASAADTFDAHGFDLNAYDDDVRDPLTLNRPGRFHQGDWYVGGLLEYAKAPLVYIVDDEPQTILDNVFAVNTSAGLSVHDFVRLDLSAPLYFSSTGPENVAQGAGLGDIKGSAMISLLRPTSSSEAGGLGIAVIPFGVLPVGRDDAFLGQKGLVGGGHLVGSYEFTKVTLTGSVGMRFNPAFNLENLVGSDVLLSGFGVGYLFDPATSLTLEGNIETPFVAAMESWSAAPSEVLLSVHHRHDNGAHWTVGAATAVTPGAGAALYRLLVGGGFGLTKGDAPIDTDGDGLVDLDDSCPEEPETVNQYADADGCPDELGTLLVSALMDGNSAPGAAVSIEGDAPTAFTSDGSAHPLTDLMPGSSWRAIASFGECWTGEASTEAIAGEAPLVVDMERTLDASVVFEVVDQAGQPIPEAVVTWEADPTGCMPDTPLVLDGGSGRQPVGTGAHRVAVTAPGYSTHTEILDLTPGEEVRVDAQLKPTKIRVTMEEIFILDKIHFETGSAILAGNSFELLDEIATTVLGNPNLGHIEVAGHTDSQGSASGNLTLSQRRAETVMNYIVDRGASAERLSARGYGEEEPIADNETPAGRATNRRVVFTLTDHLKSSE